MIHAIKEPASERLAAVGRVIVFNPDRLSSLALEALEAWTHNTPVPMLAITLSLAVVYPRIA